MSASLVHPDGTECHHILWCKQGRTEGDPTAPDPVPGEPCDPLTLTPFQAQFVDRMSAACGVSPAAFLRFAAHKDD